MGEALLRGPGARIPASWMSRNRCQDSGATSPAACTSPRIAQMSAITSPTVIPGFTVPAAVARAVSRLIAARIRREVAASVGRCRSRLA